MKYIYYECFMSNSFWYCNSSFEFRIFKVINLIFLLLIEKGINMFLLIIFFDFLFRNFLGLVFIGFGKCFGFRWIDGKNVVIMVFFGIM